MTGVILDAKTIQTDQSLVTDVCIVGAGAAGITIARQLADSQLRVSVVESGGLEFEAETQELAENQVTDTAYPDLTASRIRQFGGTTNVWHGRCRPFQKFEMERRDWIPNSGWPISFDDLVPYYKAAAKVCELPSDDFENIDEFERRVGSSRLSFEHNIAQNLLFHYSPPTNFGERYWPELIGSKNITILLHANVVDIVPSDDLNKINSVEIKTLAGNRIVLFATIFVLATGAIENARLLLISNSRQEAGLGNAYDLVGRFFMEHPMVEPGIMLPSAPIPENSLYDERDSSLLVAPTPEMHAKEEIASFTTFMFPSVYRTIETIGVKSARSIARDIGDGEFPDNLVEHLQNIITDLGSTTSYVGMKIGDLFDEESDELTVYWMVASAEMSPDPENRLILMKSRDQLGVPQVRLSFQLGEIDRRTILKGTEIISRAVGASNLGRVRLDMNRGKTWEESIIGLRHHHMGTTRMHENPRLGVVNQDCRVHGISNLFIAGGSVFPTSGSGVPTLTIVALAIRLAEKIEREFK